MTLFSTLTEYFMYSHLTYFMHIAAMLCCSEDDEYFDKDLFLVCETPGHLPVIRWCHFHCLVLSGLVIRYDVINTNFTVYSTIYRFMYEIRSYHTQRNAFSFSLKTGCDRCLCIGQIYVLSLFKI
jgi:hypothetical protein